MAETALNRALIDSGMSRFGERKQCHDLLDYLGLDPDDPEVVSSVLETMKAGGASSLKGIPPLSIDLVEIWYNPYRYPRG